jgi:ABC-type glycerol-3-phosphate transport system permease component
MPNVGVLILFAILGAFICAKARVAGGAVVFSMLALAMFISTPVGSAIPGALSALLSTVNDSTTPALTHTTTHHADTVSEEDR